MAEEEDALAAAVDELYSKDPDVFMARRAELSAAAKSAGNAAAAKQIGALRKPTRSAYTVNRLAREDQDAIAELLDLGSQLRDAEKSVDAQQIRELTTRRRRMVDELTRRAFDVSEEPSPSSALRDEVVSTLTAALADDSIADQLADGTMTKPARWEGFGFGGGSPDLTLVHSAPAKSPPGKSALAQSAPTKRPAVKKGASKEEAAAARHAAAEAAATEKAEEKAQAKAALEAAKQAKLEEASQVADDAEEALILATDEEQTRLERLKKLEEQVTDARREVDEARIQLRRAEIRQRRTRDALERLQR